MIEQLREHLRYEPETGELWWKVRGSKRSQDRPAGSDNGAGYRVVMVCGHKLRAHRIVWALHHGSWPAGDIDHIDGNRSNNRITNLRDVSHQYNRQNQRQERASKTGARGARQFKGRGRFAAQISVNGRTRYLGTYDTAEQASAVYWAAKRALHPGWVEL